MILTALSSLLGSKAGRIAAVVVLALASAALVLWQVFRKGAASEQTKQAQASLDALRRRISTDDELSKMSAADRRRELAKWVRDE